MLIVDFFVCARHRDFWINPTGWKVCAFTHKKILNQNLICVIINYGYFFPIKGAPNGYWQWLQSIKNSFQRDILLDFLRLEIFDKYYIPIWVKGWTHWSKDLDRAMIVIIRHISMVPLIATLSSQHHSSWENSKLDSGLDFLTYSISQMHI